MGGSSLEITLNINKNIPKEYAVKLTELGDLLEEGMLAEQDLKSAVRLYMLAAKMGEPGAFYRLGRACMEGRGITQDKTKAKIYFKQGAACGDIDSIIATGDIYEEEGSMKQAAYCFKLAAEAGNAEALTRYAHALEKTGDDNGELVEIYRRAAGLGNADAAMALGRIYENQKNPEYSPDVALFWYRQAVESGDATAEAEIARISKDTEKDVDVEIEYDDL